MILTSNFLKKKESIELPIVGKQDFVKTKMVDISQLYANQETIHEAVLLKKLKGKNLSVCYVLQYDGRMILIDGHHTVIAKKINGRKRVKVMFLSV